MNPADIAEIAHEANRALQRHQRRDGNSSIPVAHAWPMLDVETQTSVIDGVFGIQHGKTPRQSHENWCEFKRRHGWTYGPTKDELNREHPCLMDYDKLPDDQKLKDSLFAAIVRALS